MRSKNDVFWNYMIPLTIIFMCVFVEKGNRYFKSIILIIILIWSFYLSLHYLITIEK